MFVFQCKHNSEFYTVCLELCDKERLVVPSQSIMQNLWIHQE